MDHQTESDSKSPEAVIEELRGALKDAIECVEERVPFVRGSLLHITVQKWKRIAFAQRPQ